MQVIMSYGIKMTKIKTNEVIECGIIIIKKSGNIC